MASIKSINLLPEVFRSNANKKFLAATVDQFISEPELKKIDGYIGRKLAPTYRYNDSYIEEPSSDRQNYQLEPSFVVQDQSKNVLFYSSYIDLLSKIAYYGGLTNDHSRLFENESYNFNGLFDFDKFVNFNQYYWLPDGPPEVTVSASTVAEVLRFDVQRDSQQTAYTLSTGNRDPNPIITLTRGNTYRFFINQKSNKFWIQTQPGKTGTRSVEAENLSRQVLGVENNGEDTGVILFKVPSKGAQDNERLATRVATVNFATDLSYSRLQNHLLTAIKQSGGIDGAAAKSLNGSTVIFLNRSEYDRDWTDQGVFDFERFDQDTPYEINSYEAGDLLARDQRYDIFRIRVFDAGVTNGLVRFERIQEVDINQKVYISGGTRNSGVEFIKNAEGYWEKIVPITSVLEELYYADSSSDSYGGIIKIVDPTDSRLDVNDVIVGRKNYTSPNGIRFTNGLKVRFDATAFPAEYQDNVYIVEGVGKGIRLVGAGNLTVPEEYALSDNLSTPDYITVSRGSKDLNAWSRSNRWFHSELIELAAQYNNTPELLLLTPVRAKRPIIEFEPDIFLYQYGQRAKAPVDILDYSITDAFKEVEGQINYTISLPNNKSRQLTDGTRIIFAGDKNPEVRNRIYKVTFITLADRTQIHLVSENTEQLPTFEVASTQIIEDTTVTFVGGNPDHPAKATLVVDPLSGEIQDLVFSNVGLGYRSTPSVGLIGGGIGQGAQIEVTLDDGVISNYDIISRGTGYLVAPIYSFIPAVAFSAPVPGIGAVQAKGTVVMETTAVANVTITYGGLNYIADPFVKISTVNTDDARIDPVYSPFKYIDYIRLTNGGTAVGTSVDITIQSPNSIEKTANTASTLTPSDILFVSNIGYTQGNVNGLVVGQLVYGSGITGGTTVTDIFPANSRIKLSSAVSPQDFTNIVFKSPDDPGVSYKAVYGNSAVFSSTFITLNSVAGIGVGFQVFGEGVPVNTVVDNVFGNLVVMTSDAVQIRNNKDFIFKSASTLSATVQSSSKLSDIITVDNSIVAGIDMFVTGGIPPVGISDVELSFPVIVTTNNAHNCITGDKITIRGVLGTTELNDNFYYVEYIDVFRIALYINDLLDLPVDGRNFTDYISDGAVANNTVEFGVKVKKILDANQVQLTEPVSVIAGTTMAFIGRQAQARVYTDSSKAYAIAVTDPGAGYLAAPLITFSGSFDEPDSPAATAVLNDNLLEFFKVSYQGAGYEISENLTTEIISEVNAETASVIAYGSNTIVLPFTEENGYVKEDWLVFLVVEENQQISYRDFSRVPYATTDLTGPNDLTYQHYMDVSLTNADIKKVLNVQEILDENGNSQYEITLDGIIESLDSDGEPINLPVGTKLFITARSRFFTTSNGSDEIVSYKKSTYIVKSPVTNVKTISLLDVNGIQKGMLVTDLSNSIDQGCEVVTVDQVSKEITVNFAVNLPAGILIECSVIPDGKTNLLSAKIKSIEIDNPGAEYTSAPVVTIAPAIPAVIKIGTSTGNDRILVNDLDGIIIGMSVTSEYNSTGNGITTGARIPKVVAVDTQQISTVEFLYYVILDQEQPEFSGLLLEFTFSTKAIALLTQGTGRLIDTNDITPDTYEADDTVIVSLPTVGKNALKQRETNVNVYNQYYYDGIDWNPAQQKTQYNQAPLFDLFDTNGTSIADTSVYTGSKFAGTKIFSYKEGTGTKDSELDFAISYKNFQNVGDINFVNNYDSDSFLLIQNSLEKTLSLNQFLFKQKTESGFVYRNIWSKTAEKTKQYQIITKFFDGDTNYFQIDITPSSSETVPYVKVYVDNVLLAESAFTVTKYNDVDVVIIDETKLVYDPPSKIDILIFSKNISALGYFQIPLNIDLNTENKNFTSLTLGQLRQHLVTMTENNYGLVGNVLSKNNLRDVDIKSWTGCILQHASPGIYSGLAFGDQGFEFIEAIEYAQKEYTKFKNRFLDQCLKIEIDVNDIQSSVDKILDAVNIGKNTNMPWYDSDMVPYGRAFTKTRIQIEDIRQRRYQIPSFYDDTVPSRRSVLVYIGDTVTGTYQQLTKNTDFTFNKSIAAIDLNDNITLTYTTYIELVDRPNTTGSYVPETPSKLGLYPTFAPRIYIDDSYQVPKQVLQGHDGSITPIFGDFRDNFLLELELRIYNNIKVDYNATILDIIDSTPGKFRKINYSLAEFNLLLSRNFLRWAGTNNVDYVANTSFASNNAWTWNYKSLKDSDGVNLPGFWRAIYFYFFDTDKPHLSPWEMLGFYSKPTWWEDRYGPAPYTGSNAVLWDDLELGYIAEGDRQGIDSRFTRPGLSKIIPVDEFGKLKSPEKFAPAKFDSSRLSASWAIGDQGPVETAWRRSSEYPFALQIAVALSRPAFYFGTLMNTVQYIRNSRLDQLTISGTQQRINRDNFVIPDDGLDSGTVTLTAGYINWVRDWFASKAVNGTKKIKDLVRNIDVKLSYKMAGYSDKNFLTVIADQSSPVSQASSIILPPENYKIFLNKSSPLTKLVYSAVVVERTATGYAVRGYDLESPYFTIIPSKVNNNFFAIDTFVASTIGYRDFEPLKVIVPYGFEFSNAQQVVDFLLSYNRYLTAQGMIFDRFSPDLEEKQDWILSAKEFLTWSAQGWAAGNLLVLSPAYNNLKIENTDGIIDYITNSLNGSKILDQNFNVIKNSQFSVVREDNVFEITAIYGQTIALAQFNLIQYEHVLLMDNSTVFNDIVYQPELGNRQFRLRLLGNKTNNWTGQLNPAGFVFNDDIIDEWQSGRDYRKGTLIEFKDKIYFAIKDVPATVEFDFTYWSNIEKDKIKTGLLPNFSYNAEKFNSIYNLDDVTADAALDELSGGITGFRARSYFQDFKLDNTSQTKFYQGYIKQKGSINAIDALTSAQFINLSSTIELYEEYALRVGDYGALGSDQTVEFTLNEETFKNNPSTLLLIDRSSSEETGFINYYIDELYNTSETITNKNIISARDSVKERLLDAVTAGYPRLDDVDATIFDIKNYADYASLVSIIGAGFKIWVARDFNNNWNVFRCNETDNLVIQLTIALDNRITVRTLRPHLLSKDEIVLIKNFNSAYDGFYQVLATTDNLTFVVEGYQNLDSLREAQFVDGSGVLLTLQSVRYSRINELIRFTPRHGWRKNDRIWVDNDTGIDTWAVFEKYSGWDFDNALPLREGEAQTDQGYGLAVAISNNKGLVISGAKNYTDGGLAGIRVIFPGFLYEDPDASFELPLANNGKRATADLITQSTSLLLGRVTASGSNYNIEPNVVIFDTTVANTSSSTYQSNTLSFSSLVITSTRTPTTSAYVSKIITLANVFNVWVGDQVSGNDGSGNIIVGDSGNIVANINYVTNTITLTSNVSWSTTNNQTLTFTHPLCFVGDTVSADDGTGNVFPSGTTVKEINTLTNTIELQPGVQNLNAETAVVFSRGSGGNVQARLSPTIIESVEVVSGGVGFVTPPIIEVIGGGGSGAIITVNLVTTGAGTGSIDSCTVLNPGSGYTHVPTLNIITTNTNHGAVLRVKLVGSSVSTLLVAAKGTAYRFPRLSLLAADGGTGSGATGNVNVTNKSITTIRLREYGAGYNFKPNLTITDSVGTGIGADFEIVRQTGAVRTFQKEETSWNQVQNLLAFGLDAEEFGYALDIGSQYAYVGAPSSFASRGAILISKSTGSNWIPQQVIALSDAEENSRFGHAIVVTDDENWLYVGAPGINKVYAFSAKITPVKQQKLTVNLNQISYITQFTLVKTNGEVKVVGDSGRIFEPGFDYTILAGTIFFKNFDTISGERELFLSQLYPSTFITPTTIKGVLQTSYTLSTDPDDIEQISVVGSSGRIFIANKDYTLTGITINFINTEFSDEASITVTVLSKYYVLASTLEPSDQIAWEVGVQENQVSRQVIVATVDTYSEMISGGYQPGDLIKVLNTNTTGYYSIYKKLPAGSFELQGSENTLVTRGVAKFGSTIAIDKDGYQVVIGAPEAGIYDQDEGITKNKVGRVYIFDREYQVFVGSTLNTSSYKTLRDIVGVTKVTVDGVTLQNIIDYNVGSVGQTGIEQILLSNSGAGFVTGANVVVSITGGGGTGATAVALVDVAEGKITAINLTNAGSGYSTRPAVSITGGGATTPATAYATLPEKTIINFTSPPPSGSKIKVDVNQFSLIQKINNPDKIKEGYFGVSVAIDQNRQNIFVGSPGYRDLEYYNGKVYRYVNKPSVFGKVIGTKANLSVTQGDYIRINDVPVVFQEANFSSTKVIKDINNRQISGILARNDGVSNLGFIFDNETFQVGVGYFASNVGILIGTPDQTDEGEQATVGNITLHANGAIAAFTITNSGSGYTFPPEILVTGGNIFQARMVTSISNSNIGIFANTNSKNQSINILPGQGSILDDLGFEIYELVQELKHPDLGSPERFGSLIKTDNQTGETLIVSSEGGVTLKESSFDLSQTVFDSDTTRFVDQLKNSGAVYVYDLLQIPDQTFTSPSRYLFNQFLQNSKIFFNDNFGSGIDIRDNMIIVGANKSDFYTADAGLLHIFMNQENKKGWEKLRSRTDKVDIDYINQGFLYDKRNNIRVVDLDYFDPVKGKILGVADQDLDYKTIYDPATYNRGDGVSQSFDENSVWNDLQVGRTWWNLDTCKYIDYEQGDLNYRATYWGELFPGSTIEVCEWVESYVLPQDYATTIGDGEAKYSNNSAYVEFNFLDQQSGLIRSKYYYWVKNKTSVNRATTKRNKSVASIRQIIENPKMQDIPYFAVLAQNAFSLYNITKYLVDDAIIFNIDYGITKNDNIAHNEYELVQQGNALSPIPLKYISKLIDSLAGENSIGQVVPDLRLKNNTYGIQLRPRQSMVKDTVEALQVLVGFVNRFLKTRLIVKYKNISQLQVKESIPPNTAGFYNTIVKNIEELNYIALAEIIAGYKVLVEVDSSYAGFWTIYEYNPSGRELWSLVRIQSYDTTRYWNYADWYATGFNNDTKIDFIVARTQDTLSLDYITGNVIKVLDDGNGQFEIYTVDNNLNLVLVGAENGTIQLSDSLYDYDKSLVGFDNPPFDNVGFGKTAAIEVRLLIEGLINGIFTDTDTIEINNLFFTMLNYILSEQDNLDWLIKTSFVSVVHKIRKLETFPSYIRDVQDYFEGYINEVKPYRTQLRNYLLDYEGSDTVENYASDFDLPAIFDKALNKYRTLDISIEQDQELIANTASAVWAANYKYRIESIVVINPGENYVRPPTVTITGGGGVGAKAVATIDNATGKVIDIDLSNKGEGFTSTPTVTIFGGGGVGARAYAVLSTIGSSVSSSTVNKTVRNVKTKLSFDRTSYSSKVIKWRPYTTYHENDIVVIPDVRLTTFKNLPDSELPKYNYPYRVLKTILGSRTIDLNLFNNTTVVTRLAGSDIENAADRLAVFNQPGSPDIATLYTSPDTQRLDASPTNDAAKSQNNKWNKVVHSKVVPYSHEYQYLAIGDRSLMAISSDGKQWDFVAIKEDVDLRDACFFNGNTWIAVGNEGTLLTSNNAVNWSKEILENYFFSPNVDAPTGYEQLNANQVVDFVGVISFTSTRSQYTLAIGNNNTVLVNPYTTSLDINQGWRSAKPQPNIFTQGYQLITAFSTDFGPLTDINGSTFTVDLQGSGFFTQGTQSVMREGYVIVAGVNGNMFITTFNRIDDLMQGYIKSYNYDSGKLNDQSYPWIELQVPVKIRGLSDGTSGEQINGVAISTTFDRWIVAVGSAGTLIWNRLDSALQVQNGTADLSSDTIGKTVVDHAPLTYKNFRYFDADNFILPLTPRALETIDLNSIVWDNEKFIVTGSGSTVIWGYPGSQTECYIELGNINPILRAETRDGAPLASLASWPGVVNGTTMNITLNGVALNGWITAGMSVLNADLPNDSVVTLASYNSATDVWTVTIGFDTATIIESDSENLIFNYTLLENIAIGTSITFTGPNGATKALTVSRAASKGDSRFYVTGFDKVAANWSIAGTGIPTGARIKQIGRFPQFTWQYALGSGRNLNIDYQSISVNTTTVQLNKPFTANIGAGATITMFDLTGLKTQFVVTQDILKDKITLSFANTVSILDGFTLEANTQLGIQSGTSVIGSKLYSIGGVLDHLYKDIPDLIPGTSYSGVKVTGQPYTDTATDILSLDTTIGSEYTDVDLGIRPEDIIVNGGKFIDTFSSHAPEELVPGQVIDSLQMNVFTANVVNGNIDYGNVIAYKIFTDYRLPTVYYRLSAANTTVLTANLSYDDTFISVQDVSKLPEPNSILNQPGSVWLNGEKINYFARDLAANKLIDIRRGANRTSIPELHIAGNIITDASEAQEVTKDTVLTISSDLVVNNGFSGDANTVTYQTNITNQVPQSAIWLELGS